MSPIRRPRRGLVEKLVNQDKVNFILGPYGSATAFAAAAVVERLKVPMVEGNGSAEKIFSQGYTYTFAVLSPAKRYLEGVIDMALHMKPRPQIGRDHVRQRSLFAGGRARRGGFR